MHALSGTHLLVTGGSGFVGTGVVPALVGAGARVTVADLEPYPDPTVSTVVGDLREEAVRERAVADDVDGIVHLAAVTSVLESTEQPRLVRETNVTVTAELLELARRADIGPFVFASTNAVVGDVGHDTIDERTPLRPLTPYGSTKAAGEMLLSAYAGSYGMAACSLRFTNIYGPGMRNKDSFIARLMRAALHGHGVEIYGDGTQRRDFIERSDVVRAVLVALRDGWTGPVIVGAGRSVSVLRLVELTREATGVDIPAEHGPARPGEMPAVIVDPGRAAALGFTPEVSLEEGLRRAWRDFREREGPVPSSAERAR